MHESDRIVIGRKARVIGLQMGRRGIKVEVSLYDVIQRKNFFSLRVIVGYFSRRDITKYYEMLRWIIEETLLIRKKM